jgi:hypothetical protein
VNEINRNEKKISWLMEMVASFKTQMVVVEGLSSREAIQMWPPSRFGIFGG